MSRSKLEGEISRIGRWLSVDPLADKYPGWSPYNYCVNNPLKYVDPDGKEMDDYKLTKRHQIELVRKTNDPFDRLYNDNMTSYVTLDDKEIIPQLMHPELQEFYKDHPLHRLSSSKNGNDMAALFAFVSSNPYLEWSFSTKEEPDGTFRYFIGHSSNIFQVTLGQILPENLSFEWHNHPSTTSDIPNPSAQDMYRFKTANIKYPCFVYADMNQSIYKYNSTGYMRIKGFLHYLDFLKYK